ncbi:LacI family DNA-binding transcriptional regulator [Cerasicoccus fimbriatus]|uniref:LacI family DNA-binding transcriptional regulator n=1 Tax=Cerasicoccus fimbriatus TaxID=3014554 RepID=UPI0022B35047|nr:LacI family DNA-binding transcriptional regulator [Cerasicoccus sp. TK19100]
MTIRELAALAGVSRTTVSYGLKNDPRVSPKTCARIQALAREHGYTPSPIINTLMKEVRAGAVRHRKYSLAYLCTRGTIGGEPRYAFERAMLMGAKLEAEELGYDLELLDCTPSNIDERQLERILIARGQRGVIVGPTQEHHGRIQLNWQNFSVVCCGFSVEEPQADRVTADLFAAFTDGLNLILSRGYDPVFAVMDPQTNLRLGQRWLSVVSLQQRLTGSQKVQLFSNVTEALPSLEQLVKAGKTPAIFGQSNCLNQLRDHGFRVPEQVGLLAFDNLPDVPEAAAIIQPHLLLGRRAVAQLAMLVERGSRGVPETPCRISMSCGWQEGATLPKRSK